jgi:hypothetical protein
MQPELAAAHAVNARATRRRIDPNVYQGVAAKPVSRPENC